MQMPEPDGAVPFAWFHPNPEHVLVLAGLAGGPKGSEGLEGGLLSPVEQNGLEIELCDQGFVHVDFSEGIQILRRLISLTVPVPQEWLYMQQQLPGDILLREHQSSSGEADIETASRLAPLLDPNLGFFIQIPETTLEDGMKGIRVAFLNDQTIQREIIDAAVDACADVFWKETNRDMWTLSWEAAELVALARGHDAISDTIRHNRWLGDSIGRKVPIIRTWVDRQLAQLTAITKLMAEHRRRGEQP